MFSKTSLLKSERSLKLQKDKRRLFVGTNEHEAKTAPIQGLKAPVVISDVYAPHFAFQRTTDHHQRLGIVEIDPSLLSDYQFAPFHAFVEKHLRNGDGSEPEDIWLRRDRYFKEIVNSRHRSMWKKSLQANGVFLYMADVFPNAIMKVATYDIFGHGNNLITNRICDLNPWGVSEKNHVSSYTENLTLSTWLMGEPVDTSRCHEMEDRSSVDIFYIRAIENKWWK